MPLFLNLTRGNEIGANCYYVEAGGTGVVLDAGMHPKLEGRAALPDFDLLQRRPVRGAFLSHAHLDHTGSLPLLLPYIPEARVFMSEPTYHLAEPLLHNSVNVMKRQREERGLAEYPLFTHTDVDRCKEKWQACHLERRWSLEGFPVKADDPDPATFTLHHAGHILGSAALRLNLHGESILYTGDINFADQTLLGRATLPSGGVDTLVIECTRGAQPTPEGHTRATSTAQLLQAIQETFDRDGAVLIPIFAMGKTQELLALLHHAALRGEIDYEGLWIGGLGRVFTQIYDRLADTAPGRIRRTVLGTEVQPEVFEIRKAQGFRPKPGHIYLLPSGMMTAQTTSHRLAALFLQRPEHAVFFVGYTDPDSPAGHLRATPPGGEILLGGDSGPVQVRCPVRHFDFTSHATREAILEYIGTLQPRRCFLVHGDLPALQWFEGEIRRLHPSIEVHIPAPGREISWN